MHNLTVPITPPSARPSGTPFVDVSRSYGVISGPIGCGKSHWIIERAAALLQNNDPKQPRFVAFLTPAGGFLGYRYTLLTNLAGGAYFDGRPASNAVELQGALFAFPQQFTSWNRPPDMLILDGYSFSGELNPFTLAMCDQLATTYPKTEVWIEAQYPHPGNVGQSSLNAYFPVNVTEVKLSVCECGSEKLRLPSHSTWCPKFVPF